MSEIDRVVRISASSIVDSVYKGQSQQKRQFIVGFVESALLAAMGIAETLTGSSWVDASADDSWTKQAALPMAADTFSIPDTMPDRDLLDMYKEVGWGKEALEKFIASRLKQQPELRVKLDAIMGGPSAVVPGGPGPAVDAKPEPLAGAPDGPGKKPAGPPPIDLKDDDARPDAGEPEAQLGPDTVRKEKGGIDDVRDFNKVDEFSGDADNLSGLPGMKRTRKSL